MNKDNIRKAQLFLILVAVVVVCITIILLLNSISIKQNENVMIEDALKSSAIWPNDVPILAKAGLVITDYGDNLTEETIDSGVTYSEFREYLIKLYKSGFEPDTNFDSSDPRRLNSSLDGLGISSVIWVGNKGDYNIAVYWAEEGAVNSYGMPYYYNFMATLTINSNDNISNENIQQQASGDIESEDINRISGDTVSGDIEQISGDTVSGDNEHISGDTVSGDIEQISGDGISGDNYQVSGDIESGDMQDIDTQEVLNEM